jgi:CBS domain containing-hemolysin-like protein
MGSSLVVAIYIVSVGFLAALSAALTSLGVLSLRRAEQDAGAGDWLHRRAIDDPVHTGVALGITGSVARASRHAPAPGVGRCALSLP